MPAIHVVVLGRVQGVGFRYHVLRAGKTLQICGEVWNREDGGVEIHAEHDHGSVLGELVTELWDGPGQVEEVNVQVTEVRGFRGFGIAPTR